MGQRVRHTYKALAQRATHRKHWDREQRTSNALGQRATHNLSIGTMAVDPHSFYVDPDLAVFLHVDPDQAVFLHADPDPGQGPGTA